MTIATPPHDAPPTPRTHRRLTALFAVYLALLAWIVLWKLRVPWVGSGALRHVKVVPFVPSAGYGASDLLEVLSNVALFLPFGLYLGLLAPAWSWWRVTAVVASTSVALETVQYALAIGSSDTTDVLTNTAGGLVGFGLLASTRHRFGWRARRATTRICSVGTVVALLAVALLALGPLWYAAPGETLRLPHGGARPAVVDEEHPPTED